MADKKTEKAKPAPKEKKAAGTKRKARKEVTPTAASDRPQREHKEPKRFEFDSQPVATSRRKRAAAEKKKKAPATKRRKTTKKGGGKKKGGKKDPNAPKRPRTSFMYFSQEARDDVKKDNPDISFGEIGKELGKQWKKMKAADKKKYDKLAEKDKARYEKEKAKYDGKKSDKEESENESE